MAKKGEIKRHENTIICFNKDIFVDKEGSPKGYSRLFIKAHIPCKCVRINNSSMVVENIETKEQRVLRNIPTIFERN